MLRLCRLAKLFRTDFEVKQGTNLCYQITLQENSPMAPNREKEQFGPLGIPWVFNMAWIKEMVWKAIVFLCGLQNFRKSSTGAAPKPPYDMTLQCITLQHTVWNGYGSSVQVLVGWEVLSLYNIYHFTTLPPSTEPVAQLSHQTSEWRTIRVLRVSGMLDSLSMLARCMSSSGLTLIWSLLFLLVIQLIAAMMAAWPTLDRLCGGRLSLIDIREDPWHSMALAVGAAWIFEASIVELRGPMNCCGRPRQENSLCFPPALARHQDRQHHVCVGHCWRRSKQGGYQHQHWFVKYWKAVGEQTWQ